MKNLKIWSLALALLVALAGCESAGDKEVNNGGNSTAPFKPIATTELASKIVNKWQLVEYAGQPAEFEIFIDFASDNTYELYERAYGYEYEYRIGTYTLEGDVLKGMYIDESAWNHDYQVQIAEKPYLRLRLIEEGGVYAEYKQVDAVPENVESQVPEWDGEYRAVPAVAASGYIEITHPGQFATLVSETDAEAFVAAGKRVRIMKDLYFNNIPLSPVVNHEYFRDFELDGNGHTLYNITIECEDNKVAALFPEVVDAVFANLTINDINVDAGQGENAYAGALIGTSYGDVVVSEVVVKNSTIKGTNKVGGLVGFVAQNSITLSKSGVVNSTIETHEMPNESGLAGGLVGYIGCQEETPAAAASIVSNCYVRNTTLNVINSRNSAERANSEFIGGLGGDDGDIIYITGAKVENVTLNDSATTPLYAGLVGGLRESGRFTVCKDGVADFNGKIANTLPEADAKGVVELVTPSQFAAVLTQGAQNLKFVIKNNFDFKDAEITTLVDKNNVYTFQNLEFDGSYVDAKGQTACYTISNINVVKSAAYSALFPNGVGLSIKNLNFDGIKVDAGEGEDAYAAVLIARSYGDTVIDNVTISASEVKGTNKVGGFVGLVAEDSISLTNSSINSTTIETYNVADESGLAGGLIGYIACADDKLAESKVMNCKTLKNTYNFINSRNNDDRANSLFIGGVDGDNGDLLTISGLKDTNSTLTETDANEAALTFVAMNDYVGGRRGDFTVAVDGVAYWNGKAKALPEANNRGYIELAMPSEFVTLLNEGATGLKVTFKNSFDFAQRGEQDGKVVAVNGVLTPIVDKEKFRGFEIDGASKTISNFSVENNGAVAALFPVVVDATIKNLVVSGASVDAGVGEDAYAAAVIGTSYGKLSLTNVDVKESTVKGTNKVGALVGFVAENSITAKNCDVDGATVVTHELANESGLAGGFIGYIGCQEGSLDKSTIETCTVKNSTLTFINSRNSAERANSEFIGAIGGDEGDELVIKKVTTENNKFTQTVDTSYEAYHNLIGGKRGDFKVTVDGKSIDPVVETPSDENTGNDTPAEE